VPARPGNGQTGHRNATATRRSWQRCKPGRSPRWPRNLASLPNARNWASRRSARRWDQANDRVPTGASRLFQIATGQVLRSDFDREARSAERLATAERAIGDLKASLQADRSAYATRQAGERSTLTDRHRAEDRQLQQAVTVRTDFDRAAEVEARREQARGIARENAPVHDSERKGPDLTPA
jgi:hypothetical protein